MNLRRACLTCMIFTLLVIELVPAVDAASVFPPSWRGEDGSLYAEFGIWFEQPGEPGVFIPDEYEFWPGDANIGRPQVEMTYGAATRLFNYSGRVDVLTFDQDQGGDTTPKLMITINNFWIENPLKRIHVEITYHHVTGCIPHIFDLDWWWDWGNDHDHKSVFAFEAWDQEYDWGDGWRTRNYMLEVDPNPWSEVVEIEFWQYGGPQTATFIDQIVIDTLCDPGIITLRILGVDNGICHLEWSPAGNYMLEYSDSPAFDSILGDVGVNDSVTEYYYDVGDTVTKSFFRLIPD